MAGLAFFFSLVALFVSLVCFAVTIGAMREAQNILKKMPKLRPCSCEHGYGFHHKDTGACNAFATGSTAIECRCLRFDGEIPADLWGSMS